MKLKSLPILKNKTFLAHLSICLAIIIWAAAGPVIKITIEYIPVYTFLFLRFLIAGAIILPYTIQQLVKINLNKKDLFNFFLLGLFSETSLILVFFALEYSTVLDVTMIGVLGAIMVVYAGHYFYKDKVDTRVTWGLVLASIGTLLIIVEPILTGNHNGVSIPQRVFGNILGIIYNLTWVFYLIWSKMSMGERSSMLKKTLSVIHIKPMTKKYPPTFIVIMTIYVGLLTLTPLAILENLEVFGPLNEFNILNIGPQGLLGLFYMAIFSSLVAYILNQWGLENAKVSDTAIYSYLSPIFTLPFAYAMLGEIPNVFMIIGGIIIACGVIIAESKKS